MPNDLIRYDLLVQEALCGVVSRVLTDVSRHGLPGAHDFYITLRTHATGVRLSSRMRGLSFKGIPEILLIPFDALTGFFDPSVQFSLKFEPQAEDDGEADQPKIEAAKPAAVTNLPQPVKAGLPAPVPAAKAQLAAERPAAERPTLVKAGEAGAEKGAEVVEEAKVVSIDAFRKKP